MPGPRSMPSVRLFFVFVVEVYGGGAAAAGEVDHAGVFVGLVGFGVAGARPFVGFVAVVGEGVVIGIVADQALFDVRAERFGDRRREAELTGLRGVLERLADEDLDAVVIQR